MKWFADIVTPTTNLGDYALQTFGAFAIILFMLIAAIVFQYRTGVKKDNKIESQENEIKQMLKDRVQDAKDLAALEARPNEELKKFIGTLYDVYTRSINKPEEQ